MTKQVTIKVYAKECPCCASKEHSPLHCVRGETSLIDYWRCDSCLNVIGYIYEFSHVECAVQVKDLKTMVIKTMEIK